jgi:hypothetical protein
MVRRGKQIPNFLITQETLVFIVFLKLTDARANILLKITPLHRKRKYPV